MDKSIVEIVNNQYENYPYPQRNPLDERKFLISTFVDDLNVINSIAFKGKQNFQNFNVLIAGGGTGDGTIFLAEQLRSFPGARVTYCDLSQSSMNIAKQRAQTRNLSNITWLNQSLFDLEDCQACFDYINCSGVLHHLADPPSGLKQLQRLLKPEGVISLMLYGKTGRTAVYQIQDLLKILTADIPNLAEQIDVAKNLIPQIPDTNWWNHCKGFVRDYENGGDAGIVDLFLHAQDRPYSVEELYDFIEGSGLYLVDFAMPDRFKLRPETYSFDDKLSALLKQLPKKKQQAAIELLVGNQIKFTCYVSKSPDPGAQISDLDNIPYYNRSSLDGNQFADFLEKNSISNLALTIENKYKPFIKVGEYSADLFRLIDGKKTLQEIYASIEKKQGNKVATTNIEQDFKAIYDALNLYDLMLLRDRNTPKIETALELQNRFHATFS